MQLFDDPVLVVGATGFVGARVVAALRAQGRSVRCLVRTPAKAESLVVDGVEIVQGDMLDADAVRRAVSGAAAVVVCVHTLSRQPAAGAASGFMDVEAAGLQTIADACAELGVRRIVYVTSIGVAADGSSSWLRGRWATEQALLSSNLDATVVWPGMIVGRGGSGFGIVARAATQPRAIAVGSARTRFRTVAVDDLARDIVDLLGTPGSYGKALDAGSDDVLTLKQMAAVAARSLGHRPGRLYFIPSGVVRAVAPIAERLSKVPRGAISGFVGEGPQEDMIGDPAELRTLLGRADRPFQDAIAGQLIEEH